MPLIIANFHLTPDLIGLVGASLVFGAVFGAGLGGPMADHLGRKKLMLADMLIIAAGAATSSLAHGFTMLFIGQLLVGVGVCIDFPAAGSYISEVSPKRSRARMIVATIACQSVGMLLAAVVALLLLKNAHNLQAWRVFSGNGRRHRTSLFLDAAFEPDSPHWLMSRGRFAEAAQAFILIMPEQREAVMQITGDFSNPRGCKWDTGCEARDRDSLFSRLSGSHCPCRRSVVLDGCCYLWRRTFHTDHTGCD